ncbi:MAG: efflux RND transporter permease subunit [Candidatus Omnitrophica bacterium]|nr:efflux RND transporter permease subunit [Candidatus Omnitrophota bacterium]
MGLPQFSIRRPVTTIMVVLAVVLFGFISLSMLPQELFPPITYPKLTVATVYANAAPEEIEALITKPVEEAVGTVSGLRKIKSISKEGISLVIAEFGWKENMDFASLRVREKIDLIKERLPRDSGEPLVMKYNPFERPIMTLSVTGKRSPVDVREIARIIIKDELEKVEGVAAASISGGLEREILVEIDQARLYAQDVPIMDVVHAITNANLNYPAGTIKESFYEYLIRTLGEFEHIDEIENIPVKTFKKEDLYYIPEEKKDKHISAGANMVLLKDVATIHDTYKQRTSYSRHNGKENVSISIQKQAQVNTLRVVNRVKNALKLIDKEVPDDIYIEIVEDQSKFIKDSINGVKDAAIIGGILVFIVLYVFLRSIKSSVIVTFSIPISIMAVFVSMYLFGISINMISLAGLALGVGMLVDSAIVVLENIARHRSLGETPERAATEGTNEVSSAILASTFTTIVVFFPMAFVIGIVGQLVKDLAFTIIFALIASLVVALSVIPLLASKMAVKIQAQGEKIQKLLDDFGNFLTAFLKKRYIGYIAILILCAIALMFYSGLDKELMPKMDQGSFDIKLNMPVGTRLEVTNRNALKIEEYILTVPDVKEVNTIVGSTKGNRPEDVLLRLGSYQAEILVNLKRRKKISTKELVQLIKSHLSSMNLEGGGVEYILQESVFSAMLEESSPIAIEIKGKDIPEMEKAVDMVKDVLKGIKGVYGIRSDMPEPSPETRIIVDKDRAAAHHFSVVDIAQTSQAAIRGYIASEFKEKGQEVDIRVRLRSEDRNTFDKIARIHLTSPAGIRVPLTTLVKFERGKGPNEIIRLEQERTIVVAANIFKRPLKNVTRDIEKALRTLEVPKDCTVKLAGESEDMNQSFDSLRNALILSVLLVYMIMAGQFESLWQPFVIMFTVPLSLIGVVFALFITGTSVNVIALLGVMILGGIVVNNGIVLVDYVNLLIEKGMSVSKALVEASKTRIRPILMTAMTTIFGFLPMALAKGEGAELRAPLAISVIGGLFVSTFLSLLIIPAIYLSIHNFRLKISGKKEPSSENRA